jgi:hypothetical protein
MAADFVARAFVGRRSSPPIRIRLTATVSIDPTVLFIDP